MSGKNAAMQAELEQWKTDAERDGKPLNVLFIVEPKPSDETKIAPDEFGKAMSEIQSMAGVSSAEIQHIEDAILAMAKKPKASAFTFKPRSPFAEWNVSMSWLTLHHGQVTRDAQRYIQWVMWRQLYQQQGLPVEMA